MNAVVFPVMKNGLKWEEPTSNVDTTVPFSESEITGYKIGVRPDGSAAVDQKTGDYPQSVAVDGAQTTNEVAAALISALSLKPGNYFAAIRDLGPVNSDWSVEAPFQLVAPAPQPQAPSGLTVS